jgi:hypothetical protein
MHMVRAAVLNGALLACSEHVRGGRAVHGPEQETTATGDTWFRAIL